MTYAGVNSSLQKVVTLRANEMADHGSLRYKDLESGAHVRPDGTRWSTAGDQAHQDSIRWRGENIIQWGLMSGAIRLSNEAKVAASMFKSWMNSSGHRKIIMTDKSGLQVAFAVANGARTYGSTEDDGGLTIGVMQVALLK